jgi:hypothetical protein
MDKSDEILGRLDATRRWHDPRLDRLNGCNLVVTDPVDRLATWKLLGADAMSGDDISAWIRQRLVKLD